MKPQRCRSLAVVAAALLLGCPTTPPPPVSAPDPAEPYVLILGITQDGGYPQAGCNAPHCERAWNDPRLRRNVASLAILDPETRQRWIIDATPDFPEQLRVLDRVSRVEGTRISGILLTHAHIGHYTGLMHLGREVLGTSDVYVYAMPRIREFLSRNGPWDQLVRLKNITLMPLHGGERVRLNERITVTPFLVPHRDEYSETVGFRIDGPRRSILFIPDIDKWERWPTRIEDQIREVDAALLDGTFYADGELPGRSMSEIPHPFIVESLERFRDLPPEERRKIRFIHLNHTNPALQPGSEARRRIESEGFRIGEQYERISL